MKIDNVAFSRINILNCAA